MHIAMFCSNYPPHTGGLEVMAQNLAQGLARRHRVTVVSAAWSPLSGVHVENGVEVHRVPAWHRSETWGVPYPVPVGPGVRGALRSARSADVYHAHGALYLSTIIAARAAARAGKPLVLTEHVGFVSYPSALLNKVQAAAWKVVGDWTVRRSAHVAVYNQRVQEWLTRRYPGSAISYIGNGVNFDVFRPRTDEQRESARSLFGLPSSTPLVLFVGRDAAKKNLDAVLSIPRDGFQLVICGADRGLRLPGVFDLGLVPYARMPDLFAAADLMVLPSTGEGFPLAAQEAVASGLPLVVLWDSGYSGWLSRDVVCACDSLAKLRGEMVRLIGDVSSRARLSAAGRSWATQTWSWDATVAHYEQLYVDAHATPRQCVSAEALVGAD